MRHTIVLGAAAMTVTASLTLTVTGLVSSPLSSRITGGAFDPPPAAAEELVPFDGCDELLQWYVDEALPEVGPWGFEGGWGWGYPIAELSASDASVGGAMRVTETKAYDAVTSSDSGTNVQEVGVDEPDRAKTDGDLVVHVRGRTLVVSDVSGSAPEVLGTLPLPKRLGMPELLLDGDTVLVLGSDERGWGGPMPLARMATDSMLAPSWNSRLLEVSISDPASPRIEEDRTFGGSLLSARQYGDTVRLVLSTGLPTLDFVQPNRNRTRAEATQENRQIVRDSTIDDWLPMVGTGDDQRPLLDCADVRHPRESAGLGTLTVVTLPGGDVDEATATAVTSSSQVVYSSTDRLYLATAHDGRSTQLHAFALDGTTTSYTASGTVPGTVRDRWSMDEHDGVLRVAVARTSRLWDTTDNAVTTLREDGDRLRVLGTVRGLGPKEEIKSVRWFDDLAVVVTFRQTDPLYTVDLTDPARPRELGELKIPGFSQYLHPIGDDRLLGLGQDADRQGRTRGPQASLFDIADLASPERLATLDLGRDGELVAAYDPRTFTWLPDEQVGLAALDSWSGAGSAMVELRLAEDGTLAEGRRFPLPRWNAYEGRALPLGDGRVVVVGRELRLVTVR